MHSAAHRIFAMPEWLGSHVHSEVNNMFAMVLRRCTVCNGARRLDCLRWECSGKQSQQMVVRLFGMVLRISHTSSLDS